MRAAAQALPSEVSGPITPSVFGNLVALSVAVLMLLAVWRPTLLRAQTAPAADTATTLHVVTAGESLWALASRFYGDGHQWPSLARRNGLSQESGTVLLIGMKLRVPARVAAPARANPVADASVPEFVKAPATASTKSVASPSLAAQTVDKSDAAPAPAAPEKGIRAKGAGTADASRVPYGLARRVPTAVVSPVASSATDASVTAGLQPQLRGESMKSREPTRIGLVDREDLEAARGPKEAVTVFLRRVPEAAEVDAQARALAHADAPAPRRGEYEAAPYTVEAAALSRSGALLRRVGAPTTSTLVVPQRLLLTDEVEISAPAGRSLALGDRLMSVRTVSVGAKGPVVAVPTGILLVVRVAAGKPLLAIVQKQTGNIEEGQRLLAIEGEAAPASAHASAIGSADVETSVRWLDSTASFPTLQSYLVLGAGRAQAVRAGDEFELHTPRGEGNTGDERIARVRVVRVGASESTAIIVRQERAEIAIGVPARRVARVP